MPGNPGGKQLQVRISAPNSSSSEEAYSSTGRQGHQARRVLSTTADALEGSCEAAVFLYLSSVQLIPTSGIYPRGSAKRVRSEP